MREIENAYLPNRYAIDQPVPALRRNVLLRSPYRQGLRLQHG
jgi:hypothetical protein